MKKRNKHQSQKQKRCCSAATTTVDVAVVGASSINTNDEEEDDTTNVSGGSSASTSDDVNHHTNHNNHTNNNNNNNNSIKSSPNHPSQTIDPKKHRTRRRKCFKKKGKKKQKKDQQHEQQQQQQQQHEQQQQQDDHNNNNDDDDDGSTMLHDREPLSMTVPILMQQHLVHIEQMMMMTMTTTALSEQPYNNDYCIGINTSLFVRQLCQLMNSYANSLLMNDIYHHESDDGNGGNGGNDEHECSFSVYMSQWNEQFISTMIEQLSLLIHWFNEQENELQRQYVHQLSVSHHHSHMISAKYIAQYQMMALLFLCRERLRNSRDALSDWKRERLFQYFHQVAIFFTSQTSPSEDTSLYSFVKRTVLSVSDICDQFPKTLLYVFLKLKVGIPSRLRSHFLQFLSDRRKIMEERREKHQKMMMMEDEKKAHSKEVVLPLTAKRKNTIVETPERKRLAKDMGLYTPDRTDAHQQQQQQLHTNNHTNFNNTIQTHSNNSNNHNNHNNHNNNNLYKAVLNTRKSPHRQTFNKLESERTKIRQEQSRRQLTPTKTQPSMLSVSPKTPPERSRKRNNSVSTSSLPFLLNNLQGTGKRVCDNKRRRTTGDIT